MSYPKFVKDVLNTTDYFPSTDEMEFAYIVIYTNFDVTPAEAIKHSMEDTLPANELNVN